jgi:hypothetical protein
MQLQAFALKKKRPDMMEKLGARLAQTRVDECEWLGLKQSNPQSTTGNL